MDNLWALYRLCISTLISYIPRFFFFCNHTENPISSKADEGKTQLLQQEEASREVKEKADEGKTQVLQQEEASREVKENEAQKNRK